MSGKDTILLLGDLNVDIIMPIPRFPQPGEDCLAEAAHIRVGGGIANSACVLAGLGMTPRLVAKTGRDILAQLEVSELQAAGADVSAIQTDERAATGLTFVPVIPSGERTLVSHRGANRLLKPTEITPAILDGAKLLHLSGYALMNSPQKEAAWKAVRLAQARGIPVSLDSGVDPIRRAKTDFLKLMGEIQVAILGMDEVCALYGPGTADECLEALFARGIRVAAIKMGARGSLLASSEARVTIPAFPVDTVDTTGAGDSFSAGLIFGQVRGLSLAAGGFLAGTLGSLATTVWGGGRGLPGSAEVARFIGSLRDSGRYHDFEPAMVEIQAALPPAYAQRSVGEQQ